jgi:hypothetical protein
MHHQGRPVPAVVGRPHLDGPGAESRPQRTIVVGKRQALYRRRAAFKTPRIRTCVCEEDWA